MLTPQEIQDQKFEKAVFGGYDMEQIDKFLDVVLNDYSSLYKENAALKAKMRVLVDKIEEYRAVDEELRKTLYNAQLTAKDTISRAQSDAERILREARTAAAQKVSDLEGQIHAEEQRLEDARRHNAAYAEKIRRAMEQGMRQMEDILRASEEQPTPAPAAPQQPAPTPAATEPQPSQPEQEQDPELLAVPAEEAPRSADPQSDTARIYGDSPFTPKPRFNFSDMRFGREYDAENGDND